MAILQSLFIIGRSYHASQVYSCHLKIKLARYCDIKLWYFDILELPVIKKNVKKTANIAITTLSSTLILPSSFFPLSRSTLSPQTSSPQAPSPQAPSSQAPSPQAPSPQGLSPQASVLLSPSSICLRVIWSQLLAVNNLLMCVNIGWPFEHESSIRVQTGFSLNITHRREWMRNECFHFFLSTDDNTSVLSIEDKEKEIDVLTLSNSCSLPHLHH